MERVIENKTKIVDTVADNISILKKPDRVVLFLEYDGGGYHGYQMQNETIPTIQMSLENALHNLTNLSHRVTAASRTDRGVNAFGQVVSFAHQSNLDLHTYQRGMNYHLPKDIVVNNAFWAPPNFHVRSSAISRTYRYTIINRRSRPAIDRYRAAHISTSLDFGMMETAIQMIKGTIDVRPFTGSWDENDDPYRRFDKVSISNHLDMITVEMEASGFVTHQIRRMMGAIVQVGLGEMSVEQFKRLLINGSTGEASWMMPSEGLCLISVKYEGFPPEIERNQYAEN